MDYNKLVDLLSRTIVDAVNTMIAKAKFDRSSTGIIKKAEGGLYTVQVFGGEYHIRSPLSFTEGQTVTVTAPQNNFNKLYISTPSQAIAAPSISIEEKTGYTEVRVVDSSGVVQTAKIYNGTSADGTLGIEVVNSMDEMTTPNQLYFINTGGETID